MPATRFYRPELDALRFFAFLWVLMAHGARFPRHFELIRRTGGFGLTMFFLLSAYLITELLLRERESSGTVSWPKFFIRRALRIWPLYYAALIVGALAAALVPQTSQWWSSRRVLVGMSLFIYNWVHHSPEASFLIGPLWSLSVEEQFYVIWPPIVKFGGRAAALIAAVAFVCLSGVWILIFAGKGFEDLWFATPVQFLFFACGVLIAIAMRTRPAGFSNRARWALLAVGCAALLVAARSGVSPSIPRLLVWYGMGAVGCVAIFLFTLGVRKVPPSLAYLGKISYGLYVFHGGIIVLMKWAVRGRLTASDWVIVPVVDGGTLLLCVVLAHFSYKYFESPFLRLKQRFEVVKSRPA